MRPSQLSRDRRLQPLHAARAGTLAPAALMALVAVVSGVALVLDRLWLDAAQSELQTAVEGAALTAARLLATDDVLRDHSDAAARLDYARQKAVELAAHNRIAGQPVQLDPDPRGSIRFGKLVLRETTGEAVFIETDECPSSVVVTGEHTRSKDNPVAMFWRGLGGPPDADVATRAEASIDNHIVAFRAVDGVPIPVLPLAILKNDPRGKLESWDQQIEARLGSDRLGYDERTHRVIDEADGIPEITLRSTAFQGDRKQANVHLLALSSTHSAEQIIAHVRRGWSTEDFSSDEPEVRIDRGPWDVPALSEISGSVPSELQTLVGTCRIVFLYDELTEGSARCVTAVAGRILNIDVERDGVCRMVFQPGVLTTRTALLANETLVPITYDVVANQYIYKLQLTF